jgi:Tol biopolymer transport system component
MPASEQKATEQKKLPGIFISYRRSDTPDAVGRIYDRLIADFGKARVFKDVDSIPLGQDFRGHLNEIVGGCAAVLAIIGPRWTDIRNEAGQRRLEDPDDFVRIELEAALSRSVPVVPVMVGHAPMPGTSQLPSTLSSLAFRQSIEVRPDPDFHNDATRLVSALRAIVDPNAPQVQPLLEKQKRSWLPWLASFAIAATLAAIAFAVPASRHLRETPSLETRTDMDTPVTDDPRSFALSPDGRQIVFVANSDGVPRLWLRSLVSTTAQPLPDTEGAGLPFWSPDSRSIAFPAGGALKRLDLGGGQPQILASVSDNMGGGSWGTDGVILFVPSSYYPPMRVAATGGAASEAIKVDRQFGDIVAPTYLPDGRRFLFRTIRGPNNGIYLGALDGRTPIRLTTESSRYAWLPSGWLLWLRAGALVAQRLDVEKAVLTGEPVKVADGVNAVSTSTTGLVAYRTGAAIRRRQLTWFDRTGAAKGTIGDPDDNILAPRVAPDQRVATSRGPNENLDIWVLDGAHASRMTFDTSGELFPVWSPDGTRIVFSSGRSGTADLFQIPTNGAGGEVRLLHSDQNKIASSWSADGRYLLYFSADPKTGTDLWALPMTGDRKPFSFLKTSFAEALGQFSPDGRWVAYQSNESGRHEVYVRPFVPPGGAGAPSETLSGRWQVSTTGGMHPAWRPDGKEIYFISPAGEMMAAPVAVSGSALVPGTPIRLFQTRVVGGGIQQAAVRQYDVAPDGRFLINTELDIGATPPITLIQNWNPDAKK